eukprot:CAMPEP_0115711488 /NCGR_PEP_ID=MMETSP0272-20121206/73595_1 /TAXON_ID=71861 /ORGANISM="Scrippsiella trochoidea, Strain CCMP3099" /LENGTH=114 /DNA_ID=CAMNT_0003153295 /DNA_START=145 /DNA_END=486 /DNA_ORIENTATION=-
MAAAIAIPRATSVERETRGGGWPKRLQTELALTLTSKHPMVTMSAVSSRPAIANAQAEVCPCSGCDCRCDSNAILRPSDETVVSSSRMAAAMVTLGMASAVSRTPGGGSPKRLR